MLYDLYIFFTPFMLTEHHGVDEEKVYHIVLHHS